MLIKSSTYVKISAFFMFNELLGVLCRGGVGIGVELNNIPR
jgi:hypothetical protein